ncbi:2,5-diketo-D-gluconic acid reductase A [Colletotrichum tofieldiae]|nr:2,5-diketo-D-gluconic acid reductase A [Colletotrichum tofieldiae]
MATQFASRQPELGMEKVMPTRQDSGYASPCDSPRLTVRLNDGNEIPQIALGPNGQETEDAVIAALDAGYRHIDSAARYANEEACGRALRKSEVFITTKLWDADHGYEATFKALCDSLEKFKLDYFDLYLIHSPPTTRRSALLPGEPSRPLSVSASSQHLEELMQETSVVPAVNQIEVHPFCQRQDLVDTCRKHGIAIEAYSPLARGNKLEDPTVGKIAEKYGKTPAQILLNWNASRGNIVLPKSLTAHRIKSNFESFDFELSQEDIATIDALDENYVTGSLHKE